MSTSRYKAAYLGRMGNAPGAATTKADMARVCELLFATAAEGLVVVDERGTILMHNPRLGAMFGHAEGELLGASIETLLPKAVRDRHVEHRAAYNQKPVRRSMGIGMDLRGERKDGSVFPVEISLNHFEVDGERYVMGLVTDITLRHTAEQELHRINQELEQRVEQRTAALREAEHNLRSALEKEKELNSLKGRFVAMASHEFRTPLSTIMSSVDLIGRYTKGTGDERIDKHVARIKGKVHEMTAMLNEFLSLERMDEGQAICTPVDLDVVHLFIELMEELRAQAKPGQTIGYDHAGDERQVRVDRQMLSNVVANLVTNALKYSAAGKPVALRTAITDDRLTINVADQGMGIAPEDRPHLFDRFYRGANAVGIQGTGLGLDLVRRYLDLMGGTIRFTSAPGNTEFTVDLPQTFPDEDHPADRG